MDFVHALERWTGFEYMEKRETGISVWDSSMDRKKETGKIETLGSCIDKSLEQKILFKWIGDSIGEMKQGQVMDGIKWMINALGFILKILGRRIAW